MWKTPMKCNQELIVYLAQTGDKIPRLRELVMRVFPEHIVHMEKPLSELELSFGLLKTNPAFFKIRTAVQLDINEKIFKKN